MYYKRIALRKSSSQKFKTISKYQYLSMYKKQYKDGYKIRIIDSQYNTMYNTMYNAMYKDTKNFQCKIFQKIV